MRVIYSNNRVLHSNGAVLAYKMSSLNFDNPFLITFIDESVGQVDSYLSVTGDAQNSWFEDIDAWESIMDYYDSRSYIVFNIESSTIDNDIWPINDETLEYPYNIPPIPLENIVQTSRPIPLNNSSQDDFYRHVRSKIELLYGGNFWRDLSNSGQKLHMVVDISGSMNRDLIADGLDSFQSFLDFQGIEWEEHSECENERWIAWGINVLSGVADYNCDMCSSPELMAGLPFTSFEPTDIWESKYLCPVSGAMQCCLISVYSGSGANPYPYGYAEGKIGFRSRDPDVGGRIWRPAAGFDIPLDPGQTCADAFSGSAYPQGVLNIKEGFKMSIMFYPYTAYTNASSIVSLPGGTDTGAESMRLTISGDDDTQKLSKLGFIFSASTVSGDPNRKLDKEVYIPEKYQDINKWYKYDIIFRRCARVLIIKINGDTIYEGNYDPTQSVQSSPIEDGNFCNILDDGEMNIGSSSAGYTWTIGSYIGGQTNTYNCLLRDFYIWGWDWIDIS